jgi:hypothetical protein
VEGTVALCQPSVRNPAAEILSPVDFNWHEDCTFQPVRRSNRVSASPGEFAETCRERALQKKIKATQRADGPAYLVLAIMACRLDAAR